MFALIFYLFDISNCKLLRGLSMFFNFLGEFSLELYLIHLALITITNLFGIPSTNSAALIWIVISIVGAWGISKVAAHLSNKIEQVAFANETDSPSYTSCIG